MTRVRDIISTHHNERQNMQGTSSKYVRRWFCQMYLRLQGQSYMQASESNANAAGNGSTGMAHIPGLSTSAHSEHPANPFALPPSKKRRAMNDGSDSNAAHMPGDAQTVHAPATTHPPSTTAPDRMVGKPVVWFNDNIQVQHIVPSVRSHLLI